MKKKYTNILLATAVLAIWFLIIKRVVNTLGDGSEQYIDMPALASNNSLSATVISDSLFFQALIVNRKKPFAIQTSKQPTNSISKPNGLIQEQKTEEVDSIALYINNIVSNSRYFGMIENDQKSKVVALVNIEGELRQVKAKDFVKQGQVQVLKVTDRFIALKYHNRTFEIAKK